MSIALVNLRTEAIAEVQRLIGARALCRDGDEAVRNRLEGDGPWILIARRTRLRQTLGRRACLVWRVTLEDAEGGRPLASRLVPVLVEMTRSADRHSSESLERFLREADARLRALVEAESEAWRVEVARVANAFASARLKREVVCTAPGRREDNMQPGLFDRRAERSREAAAAAAAESERVSRSRIVEIRSEAEIVCTPARLVLVVVP